MPSTDSTSPSQEFLKLKDEIIHWNKVMRAYQGDNEYNISEVRKNALKVASSIPGNKPESTLKLYESTLEWIYSQSKSSLNIMYIHGGGFVAGSLDNHRPFAKALSKYLNANILMVGYPLAPENPYPIPLNNCIEAYKFMVFSVDESDFCGIIGDSAGANLALSAIMKLRDDAFYRLPDFAVFLSGFFDLSLRSPSINEKVDEDIVLRSDFLELSVNSYCGNSDLYNPYISPVYGDFTGLPRLFFQVGSSELLVDDSIRCHKRAKSFNVDSGISIWPQMIHSFQSYHRCIPEAVSALEELDSFIASLMSKPVLT